MEQKLERKLGAEFVGTFALVLIGCGSAVLTAGIDPGGIGILGVALAFGVTVLVMAYGVGHISGGHFNPAVTVGMVVGRRMETKEAVFYIVVQVIAAVAAAAVLYVIADGIDSFDAGNGFAANGYGDHSPQGYRLLSGLVTEVVMTAFFVLVILGATSKQAPQGFAPIAIGLALTLAHFIAIPITNASINPARSTGPALFVGESWPLEQLWLFWVAPLAGAIGGAAIWRYLLEEPAAEAPSEPAATPVRQPAGGK